MIPAGTPVSPAVPGYNRAEYNTEYKMSSIILSHISRIYKNGFRAVNDFNLNIRDHEFIVLVGPSGCGKSTLLRMIAGLEDISEGELWIDSQLMNMIPAGERHLSMVFQNYALYPNMTVRQNISFGLESERGQDGRRITRSLVQDKVGRAAGMLGLEPLMDRRPSQLSGGQRQRVAIGSAIVRDAKAYLMDEPLSNLDAKLRARMRVEIRKLYDQLPSSVIYVTHDQIEAMTLATRIVVMNAGEIQQVGTPDEIYENPTNLFVAGFIGSPQMNFIKASAGLWSGGVCLETEPARIALPDSAGRTLMAQGFIGKSVILGIRPEDLSLSGSPDALLPFHLELTENLGSYRLLHGFIPDNSCPAGDGAGGTGNAVIARIPDDVPLPEETEFPLYINTDRVHLFRGDTGAAILL